MDSPGSKCGAAPLLLLSGERLFHALLQLTTRLVPSCAFLLKGSSPGQTLGWGDPLNSFIPCLHGGEDSTFLFLQETRVFLHMSDHWVERESPTVNLHITVNTDDIRGLFIILSE